MVKKLGLGLFFVLIALPVFGQKKEKEQDRVANAGNSLTGSPLCVNNDANKNLYGKAMGTQHIISNVRCRRLHLQSCCWRPLISKVHKTSRRPISKVSCRSELRTHGMDFSDMG
jgi:hypothetical protein